MRIAPLLVALAGLAPATPADVLVVDALGGTPYTNIQAAVDAAHPGDLVLVRQGLYPGFDVLGHDLAVAAFPGAQVQVQGTVSVAATPAGSTVRLSGLVIRGPAHQPTLWIHDNPGLVRVTGCTVDGADVWTSLVLEGGPGVELQSNSGVLLAGCEIKGGHGGGLDVGIAEGKKGGAGVRTRTTLLAIYDSKAIGGIGGAGDATSTNCSGGSGGEGILVEDCGVFLSKTSAHGGQGGYAWQGGVGGTGLVVQSNSQAQLLASSTVGGQGGPSDWWGQPGAGGPGTGGSGTIQYLPGPARLFEAPALGLAGGLLQVSVQGAVGDEVWVRASWTPAHVPALALSGLWFVGRPNKLPVTPMAVLGAFGTAKIWIPLPAIAPGEGARELYLQGWIRTPSGESRLGSPMHVAVLDFLP
jgi:hypothetical protein